MAPATHASRERALALALAALAAGVILSFGRLHADNNDASLYTLVAQDLARQRTPFLLRNPPMPGLAPGFYEHPPLWFWVQALALGAGLDLRLLGAACGVLTVVATFLAGSALVGARAAFLGSVLLLATDAFSAYQPMARLDPPLTLACAASIAILVRSGGRPAVLFAGGAIAGLGVLVKGPPALAAPLSAALLLAALGRRDVLRRPRAWLAVAGGAALPALAFFGYDHLRLGGAWWQHYVLEQVLASAAGGRRGSGGPGALWHVSHGRLMHVWPLAAVALARPALGRWAAGLPPRAGRVRWALLAAAALVYVGMAASGRPYWWYLMPAYPALALLGGAGADDLLGWAVGERGLAVAGRVALAAGAALLLTLPARVFRPLERPCIFGGLAEAARDAAGGGVVAMLSPEYDYSVHVILAEHCACRVAFFATLDEAVRAGAASALVSAARAVPAGWRVVARHGAWSALAPSDRLGSGAPAAPPR